MKNQASVFLKQIFSVVISIVKAKSIAVKSKTSAMKTRLLIFGLLKNKKVLMTTISHKIHALLGQGKGEESDVGDQSKAIVVYNEMTSEVPSNTCCTELITNGQNVIANDDEEDDDDYPDLTHSLFDEEEDELDNGSESVIDLVRNSKEDASDFCLEDEIDHVADVFIRRFHRQMRMQKQQSFKRYQEMLNRGV